MPTRRAPELVDPADGLTAETAVRVMRTGVETLPLPDDTGETDEESALLERMQGMLDENDAARVYLKLYRLTDGPKKKYGWCADYTPDDYQTGGLSMIRDEWGPGDYQLRLMGPRGLSKVLPITIEPDARNPVAVIASNPAPQSSELAQVLKGMQETQAAMLQALTQRPDPMASMRDTLALVASMRDAFGLNGAPQPLRNPMAEVKELLAMTREVKATAKELAGDEPASDPDNPMALLSQGLDMVKTVMSNQRPAPIQQSGPMMPLAIPASIEHAAQPAHSNITPEPPGDFGTHNETHTETAEEMLMRGTLEDLCQLAVDGKPASDGAEFIFQNLPDALIPMMSNRYWFEVIAMKYGFIREHETWLREAKALADKLFADDAALPDDESGSAG